MTYFSSAGQSGPVQTMNPYATPRAQGPQSVIWEGYSSPQHIEPPRTWPAPYAAPHQASYQQPFSSPAGPWSSPYQPQTSSPLRETYQPAFHPRSPEEYNLLPVKGENGMTRWQPVPEDEPPAQPQLSGAPFTSGTPSINNGQISFGGTFTVPAGDYPVKHNVASKYEIMAAQDRALNKLQSRVSAGRYSKTKDFQARLRQSRINDRDNRVENSAEKADFLHQKQVREEQLRMEARMQDANRQQLEAEAMAEGDEPMFDEDQEIAALAEEYYREEERRKELEQKEQERQARNREDFESVQRDMQRYNMPPKTLEEIEYLCSLKFPHGVQEDELTVTPTPLPPELMWPKPKPAEAVEKSPKKARKRKVSVVQDPDFDMGDAQSYEEAFQQAMAQDQATLYPSHQGRRTDLVRPDAMFMQSSDQQTGPW